MAISDSPASGRDISASSVPSSDAMKRFFQALDEALIPFAHGERLDIYHLGRSALVWSHHLPFSTKDIDFVQMRTVLEAKALALFGEESANAAKWNLYLDLVPEAWPPLPGGFKDRSKEVFGGWQVIRLWQLEVHDLASSKLRGFRPQDRQDLKFLCDQGALQAVQLRKALESAFMWDHEKDGDPMREAAFAHLQIVIDYLEGRTSGL